MKIVFPRDISPYTMMKTRHGGFSVTRRRAVRNQTTTRRGSPPLRSGEWLSNRINNPKGEKDEFQIQV